MGDFQAATTVDAAQDAVFGYLSTVDNLPAYFTRMTSATAGDGEEVHTSAQLPHGKHVEGNAWFRVDPDNRRIEWGSKGDNNYHGSLEVHDARGNCEVRVSVHTTRVPDGDNDVQRGLHETLANIKRLVEQQHVAG
ncbi:SRPBCC family protein [Actinokineospora inagensis]|uniref:SRPBCC family protein n=1 Tax=Actinokineospora inagensis TaxID=103730 RepID=UPI00041262A0|nr:SRPBCC family protein [Actinokineospora inagensis]